MASMKKFKSTAVVSQLRHNSRCSVCNSNEDIVPELSSENYYLGPDIEYEHFDSSKAYLPFYNRYKCRKSELYVYNRSDVVSLVGWVVTVPKEVQSPEAQRQFFQTSYNFLKNRYGEENVVQAVVHYDEGKYETRQNAETCSSFLDDKGPSARVHIFGRPHLHFLFIPVVADNNPNHPQKEKLCAKEVITRQDLKSFHSDFQKYLFNNGIDVRVQSGITNSQGGNITVEKLKQNYELQKEVTRLQNELAAERSHEWGHSSHWGHNQERNIEWTF